MNTLTTAKRTLRKTTLLIASLTVLLSPVHYVHADENIESNVTTATQEIQTSTQLSLLAELEQQLKELFGDNDAQQICNPFPECQKDVAVMGE